MKTLVAFFSAQGTTKKVAEELAQKTGADLFEIVPVEPYTKADLNWMNKASRSSVEMADPSSRPAILGRVSNMADYTHVFVGFPVWWYREPSIIDTFLESYEWKGITIIPFCTSGSSDIGDSGELMQALAPEAKVLTGARFKKNASEKELKAWAENVM